MSLNEQTLLNPCTSNRKLLTTIIEEHGEVEHLGSCFAEDALRKTQVRVSMVHLRKKREEPKFSFDAGSDEEGAAVFSDGSRFESEVATRDTVGNLVAQYGRYRELFVQIAHLAQELAHYAGPLGTDGRGNGRGSAQGVDAAKADPAGRRRMRTTASSGH